MDPQTPSIKRRSCFKCGFEAETAEKICPQCGRMLRTSTSIRIRGALMVTCGVILMGLMGYILIWTLDATAQSRFAGTQQQLMAMLGLFGLIIFFGLFSFVTGLLMLIQGRRNKMVAWAVATVGILIFAAGAFITWRYF
jgi:hypothetical protein